MARKIDREALDRAEAHAARYAFLLGETAKAFARGKASLVDLLDAAKKATNAEHAAGRARKQVAS